MIRGIKFVSVAVGDQDASLKFFTEKLGFKIATDQPLSEKQRWIELLIPGANTGLVLFTPDGHENRIGGFQPFSFWLRRRPRYRAPRSRLNNGLASKSHRSSGMFPQALRSGHPSVVPGGLSERILPSRLIRFISTGYRNSAGERAS